MHIPPANGRDTTLGRGLAQMRIPPGDVGFQSEKIAKEFISGFAAAVTRAFERMDKKIYPYGYRYKDGKFKKKVL